MRRPAWIPVLEGFGLLASAALLMPLVIRAQFSWWMLLFGILAADLASGTVHWFCDNFCSEDTPVVGRLLIAPFREHHRDPHAITRHGWLELIGNSGLALTPVMGLSLIIGVAESFVATFSPVLMLTNVFHKWAHEPDPPLVARWLQTARLILPPAWHSVHHRDGRRAYCITCGWLNPLLDRLLPSRPANNEQLATAGD
jgi:ubiquitin-conjugating enzyme E2 variant